MAKNFFTQGFLGRVAGVQRCRGAEERGCKSVGAKHSGNRLSVKSDRFLAGMLCASAQAAPTPLLDIGFGFLNQIWVRMQRLETETRFFRSTHRQKHQRSN
jgi:hypothetical protein